jgi:hypothetical protein
LKQLAMPAEGVLEAVGVVGGDEGAEGAAADHDQFQGLEQRRQMASPPWRSRRNTPTSATAQPMITNMIKFSFF